MNNQDFKNLCLNVFFIFKNFENKPLNKIRFTLNFENLWVFFKSANLIFYNVYTTERTFTIEIEYGREAP